MPETAANHAAEPYSLSTGESGAWEGEDRENARGRRRSSGTPAAARSKDGDGCQIRPRSLGEDDAFSQHASASIPRVDPREQPTPRLRHVKADKTVTATIASVNHTVSTRNGDAPLPTRASPGARNEVVLPADDTVLFRSAGHRASVPFGAGGDGVATLLEAASKGTRDRRCSGDVCGVRSPFRKGLLKSAGTGMTASRSCVRVPSDVTDGNTQRLCGGSRTHPHRRPDCCEGSQRDTTPRRVSCRLVTALLRAFCCGGHRDAERSQRVGVLSLVRRAGAEIGSARS